MTSKPLSNVTVIEMPRPGQLWRVIWKTNQAPLHWYRKEDGAPPGAPSPSSPSCPIVENDVVMIVASRFEDPPSLRGSNSALITIIHEGVVYKDQRWPLGEWGNVMKRVK